MMATLYLDARCGDAGRVFMGFVALFFLAELAFDRQLNAF